MSNPKFAAALEELGVEPPMKISPATGKPTYAFAKTDAAFKMLLEHYDPRVQALMAARFKNRSTLEEGRLEKFIRLADLGTPISIPLTYCAAHTIRFGGSGGLNFQNLPRSGELRRALKAPPGYKVVAGDLSQIEARIVACLAEETELIEAFAKGEDVYCLFASDVYSRTITKADTRERFMGKTAILGLGFGMGAHKLRATVKNLSGLDISIDEAYRIVQVYRAKYPKIQALWKRCKAILQAMTQIDCYETLGPNELNSNVVSFFHECMRLPNGLNIHYPGLSDSGDGFHFLYRGDEKAIWGGGFLENIVQALARLVASIAEIRLAKRRLHSGLQVHDELVYCVLEKLVPHVVKALDLALTAPVDFLPNLPVACEIKVGNNYAEAK
jgi:DNA polymerase